MSDYLVVVGAFVIFLIYLSLETKWKKEEVEKSYQKGKEENIGRPANLEDLKAREPRNFVISHGPFLGDCSRTKDCSVKFFLLDFVNLADNSADMLLLKLDITDNIILKEVLKKTSKGEIKQGVKFSVDENHNITKTKL